MSLHIVIADLALSSCSEAIAIPSILIMLSSGGAGM
jgi:hypothetical protein